MVYFKFLPKSSLFMVYLVLRFLMKLALLVFFRKVFFSGASQISRDQPLILACNHPNSFLDAVVLAVLIPRPLHFLARSDVFDKPWKHGLLSLMHLIPVYRKEEGSGHLPRNEETFRRCTQILADNGAVLVFSEGICVLEKCLRPLRKGTARLAFFAEHSHDFSLQVQVVPIGLNYTHPDSFRGEVMVGVGQPFSVRPWRDLYRSQPARAIMAFNQVLRLELEKNMVSLPSKKLEMEAEGALKANRAVNPSYTNSKWLSASSLLLEKEMEIARHIREANQTGAVLAARKSVCKPAWSGFLPKSILLWLSFPFLLLPGLVLNGLPALLSWYLTLKAIKRREFYASVLLAAGFLIFPLFWLGLLVCGVYAWGWPGLAGSLLVPLSVFPALRWLDACRLEQLRGNFE